ncbi:MAG: DUF2927 domain-containing protein [Rhodospirillaceae bacterium]|nr:DUF2927 domain-containing protein [Rhodospirillaceae bacterium]MYJ70758.1 DUF2927 domain-containing protein [Rhodospirillaceae bacterium]
MNRRAASLLLLLLLAALAAGLAAWGLVRHGAVTERTLSDRRVARHFLTIAFGREHADRPRQHLAKWRGGIRYRVVRWTGGPDTERAEAALHRQMRDLAGLTGLAIVRTTLFDANFLIALTGEDLFAWQVRRALAAANRPLGGTIADANCAGFFGQDVETGAIVNARILIPVDRAVRRNLLERCIVEETAQVLGLPNDADGGVRSVFNDADHSTALSRLDRLFLALLYDPRLEPGLSRAETARRVRQILPALRRRMDY